MGNDDRNVLVEDQNHPFHNFKLEYAQVVLLRWGACGFPFDRRVCFRDRTGRPPCRRGYPYQRRRTNLHLINRPAGFNAGSLCVDEILQIPIAIAVWDDAASPGSRLARDLRYFFCESAVAGGIPVHDVTPWSP